VNQPTPFPIPEGLPPKTAMALFELLTGLTDALWQHYEAELVELIMADLKPCPESQHSFDFNDDIPF